VSARLVLAGSVFAAALACTSRDEAPLPGACAADLDPEPRCGASVADGGTAASLGLAAFTCTGGARPDEAPTYVEGVPRGLVCADRALPADGDARGFCCTTEATPCAFNPVALCDPGTFGFECRGADRPDALNPALQCGQGLRSGDLIDYCCAGMLPLDGCLQSDSVVCSPRLLGWTCRGQNLPRGEELGANRSRADTYRLLCPVPTPAPNPAYNDYCCFPPAVVPEGGSCVEDTAVPGCAPGRFGFACYGPERPEADYPPMRCPDPGVPGASAEGYPATLYCCDFQ
jgi:hypothetical protein